MTILLGVIVGALLYHWASRGRGRASLNMQFTRVRGRSHGMVIIDRPAVEFIDTEYEVASISPKDADGRLIHGHVYTWEVIEQVAVPGEEGDVVTIVVAEDTLSAEVHSGVPGTAIVTVTDDNTDPDKQMMDRTPVTIKYGVPESLNMSFGTPLPETK